MRNNINTFLINMENILSRDLIQYIYNIIVHDKNIFIIQKQKKLKKILNKDIINFHNTYYYDNNCMIYRNEYNQFILKNLALNQYKSVSLYSNNSSNILLNNDNENIVLFNTNNNEYYNNGVLIEKKITLNIMYI